MRNTLFIFLLQISSIAFAREGVSFIVVSDLHFNDSSQVNYRVNDSIVECMNMLREEDSPEAISMNCKNIRGVVVTGDVTDDGLSTSFERFGNMYGLVGERKLKYPVYEGFGNHDGDMDGYVRQQIKQRNLSRKGLQSVSGNKLHYSWNWENIHLIQLNIYPGNEWDPACDWCKYFKTSSRDAQESLSFLKEDLQNISDKSTTPVVIFMHYGWDGFSKLWWTEAEQEAFYKTIKDFNVIGIFHGHDHGSKTYNWRGIRVFDAGSSFSGNKNTGSFMMVYIHDGQLECKIRNINEWCDINTNVY